MLRKSIARVEADFDFSADIDHNASKGAFREKILKKLLRPFLPGAYGISGGQAFDSQGVISKQLDVVIYDAIHSYTAPYTDDFIYFPCESVFGNIEIKSKLNKQSLYDALKNIESLKKLKRNPIDTYYVNPIKPLQIANVNWDIQATSEYFGIVFAYESISGKKILEHIKSAIDEGVIQRDNIPNLIVLFKDQKIITRYQKCSDGMYTLQPLKTFNGLLIEECKDSVLADFLITLFIMLRSIELKAMDIEDMSRQIQSKLFSENYKSNQVIDNIIL